MVKRIVKRNLRQPLSNLAVVLFASVLTVALCWLHRAQQEEQRSFEEAYASVPVFFKITDLDGSRVTDYDGIDGWIAELLTDTGLYPNLSPYVKELHVRVSYKDFAYKPYVAMDEKRGELREFEESVTVTGITSTLVAEELTAGWGGSIHWFEGYDESILMSDEFVFVVPELLKDEQEIEIRFVYDFSVDGKPFHREMTKTFKVVGYYVDSGNSRFYCPYPTMEWIYARLGRTKPIEEIGAILNDNNSIRQLRETAAYWFAEPNPTGEPTPWGRFDFEYYFYALDINDNMLRSLEADMKNSLRMNQLTSAAVFALSAGAGFLTGFLVIRSRKREISLMRTLGAPNWSIFIELELEQILCIIVGIAIGGSYALWEPIGRLGLFCGIYAVGLTAALCLFLRANLLATIKEDE